jgi:4-amino-4-deoxy-L-arabinose transferase-like glycosyltransferase
MILEALLPWTAAVVVALVAAAGRAWRGDVRLRILLAWVVSILLPLSLIGNKQFHYLFPSMVPMALLFGWAFTSAAESPKLAGLVRNVMTVMLAIGVPLAAAVPVIGHKARGAVNNVDCMIAGVMVLGVAVVALMAKLRGALPAVVCGAIATASIMAVAEAFWISDVEQDDARGVAQFVRENVGPGPYCYYGANLSLPLCFELREKIPFYDTPE